MNAWIAQNNEARKEDFLYYLVDSLVRGKRDYIKIPHDKFVIGLPANLDAADNGYIINPTHLTRAIERLEASGTPVRGIMTWSVNWDAGKDATGRPYNWEFLKRYCSIFGGDSAPEQPENVPDSPQRIRVAKQTHKSIMIEWDTGLRIEHYTVYRDGAELSKCMTSEYLDEGLSPERAYSYYVTATSVSGLTSPPSPEITTFTLGAEGALEQWCSEKWFDRKSAVSWQGIKYICQQEHTSNRWWPPHLASSLWSRA